MARYYESEALIEFVKQNTPHMNGETTMKCVEFAIKNAPTADVVPKREVKRMLDELRGEIRKIAGDYPRGALLALLKVAELEEKYTEGEPNG